MRTHRHEVIVHLLERFNELVDPVRAGQGNGLTGLLLMPPTYTESVRELERLLVEMRNDRHRSLIDINGERVSVRSLWWHVNERFLRCESSIRELQWKFGSWQGLTHGAVVAQPGGWHLALAAERAARRRRLAPTARVRVVTWDPGVKLSRVDAGVDWLADEWQLGSEPMLPRELMVA